MALFSIPLQFNSPPLSLPRRSLFPSSSSSSFSGFDFISLTKPQHLHLHWLQLHKPNTLCISRCVPRLSQNPNAAGNTDQKPPWIDLIILYLHRLGEFLKHKFTAAARWIREMMISDPKDIALLALGVLLMLSQFRPSHSGLKEVPYSELVNGIKLGHVSAVDFEEDSSCIYFDKISNEEAEEEDASSSSKRYLTDFINWFEKGLSCRYSTRKMKRDEKFLLGLLREKGVIYRSVPPPVSKLPDRWIGPITVAWIGIIPLIWILERRLHGHRKKYRTGTRQMVSFIHVQGVDSAKEELIEVVNCLRGNLDYKELGAKLPTGILLVGPPGTGKTLLARAVAGEAGVPFFSISASEFIELYAGRGAARVRDLFKEARQEAPAIIFIDELDAVGTKRTGFYAERDQTLNQLLTEMDGFDGFDSDKQVIVLAATNRAAALDPALLRPGRFSRKVFVGEPDFEGRKRIMTIHLFGVPLEEELGVVCDFVASLTEGFVGADLANIANEAALLAARRGGKLVTREDIMKAIEREKFGINENKANAITGSKGLEKLFQWLPSVAQDYVKNKIRDRNAIGSRRVFSN